MADPYIEANAPPSSYAIADVIEARPGAWPRTVGLTAWRSVVIAPGLALAGVRGRRLVAGSIGASCVLTAYLLGYYWVAKRRQR